MNYKLLCSKGRVILNILQKKPILTIFDVTKLCNQRCPMCNIWKNTSVDMNLREIEERAKELHHFGIGYVFLQGGEPLIRKDILQIVDIFLKYGIRPTIITNGILLTPQLAKEIAKRECNLAISIDSLEKEKYTVLRGVNTLERVINNIEALDFLQGKHRGNWSITTTVTKMTTLADVKRLRKFAYRHGFMYAIRPYIHVNGTAGKKDERLVYAYKDVLEIFYYMLARSKKENFLAYLIYQEHISYIQGRPMPECDALNYSFLMKENGRLAPCIEFSNIEVTLKEFRRQKKQHKACLDRCNASTPCFYNDAREIGFLVRKKWTILRHVPALVRQMKRYGNFF
ncbi:MAG: radical SAM protein [Lachnospiraceae bacterium]|nr:radical SAM protein [Lachnospiraceae bacterium]